MSRTGQQDGKERPKTVVARQPAVPSTIAWPTILPLVHAQVLALQHQFDITQWWPAEQLTAHQLRQVQVLIAYASRYAPFWKDRLAGFGDLSRGALTMSRFRSIPVMVRTDIQDAGTDLFATHLPADHGQPFPVRTSGSTGTPIEARGTTMTWIMQNALSLRGHLWHRRDLTAKNVDIRNPLPPGRDPKGQRWSPVPGTGTYLRLDIGLSISELLDRVLEEDPAYLQTHPYTLLGMIELSVQIGEKPRSLREVRTFGETLEPRIRRLAQEAWGVPVVENYSANEMGTMAHQRRL